MLIIYRRHLKNCPHHAEGRKYRRCHCPIWVDGTLGGPDIRQSLGIRDWQKAAAIIQQWEAENQIKLEPAQEPITIKLACEKFIADAEARHLREGTLYKYRLLFRQLQSFAGQRGIRHIGDFDLNLWREFRTTWPNRNVAALKKLGYLRTFIRFCHDNGWLRDNPGRKLTSPRVTQRPTMPFTRDEMVNILAAAKPGSRVRALIFLLRYSGLRIQDATTLGRDRVTNGKLLLYTAKTGVLVYCPLPEFVANTLDAMPPRNRQYFFWTGRGKPKSVVSYWQRQLQKLFEAAKVANGHAHRFRDTFAVELLLAGTPIERVAALLGHTSIKTTEKHYAPWTRSRQEQLEADVERGWLLDPIAFAEMKGTPEVHGKPQRLN